MIFSTGPIVSVGSIGKPHGFNGRLKFHPNSDIDIDIEEPVFIPMDGKPVPFFISEISGSGILILQIEGVDSHEHALNFVGKDVYISGDEEADDEFVLTGYTIQDEVHGTLGEIIDEDDLGSQSVLIVSYKDQEVLIPFVDAIIQDMDHDEQIVFTKLPDGLLDL